MLGLVTPPLQNLDASGVERKYLYAATLQDVRSNAYTWRFACRKLLQQADDTWINMLVMECHAGAEPDEALYDIVESIGNANMPKK